MYFRFGSALVLLILMSVAGVAIEKQCLALKRAIMRQQYRREVLEDEYARLRLETQQLGAPMRLFEALDAGRFDRASSESSSNSDVAQERSAHWQSAQHADR
jgi:cell division protein FtsL